MMQIPTLPELRGITGLLGVLHHKEKAAHVESLMRKQVRASLLFALVTSAVSPRACVMYIQLQEQQDRLSRGARRGGGRGGGFAGGMFGGGRGDDREWAAAAAGGPGSFSFGGPQAVPGLNMGMNMGNASLADIMAAQAGG